MENLCILLFRKEDGTLEQSLWPQLCSHSSVPNTYLQALLDHLLVHTRGSRRCRRRSKAVACLDLLGQLQHAANQVATHRVSTRSNIHKQSILAPDTDFCQHREAAVPVHTQAVL